MYGTGKNNFSPTLYENLGAINPNVVHVYTSNQGKDQLLAFGFAYKRLQRMRNDKRYYSAAQHKARKFARKFTRWMSHKQTILSYGGGLQNMWKDSFQVFTKNSKKAWISTIDLLKSFLRRSLEEKIRQAKIAFLENREHRKLLQ